MVLTFHSQMPTPVASVARRLRWLALPRHLLGPLDVVDVRRDADVAEELTRGRDARHTAGLHPAVDAIVPPEPELGLERRAPAQAFAVGSDIVPVIVRVDELRCVERLHVRLRQSTQVLAVDAIHELKAFQPVLPDQHRRVVGQQAKALLAVAQRFRALGHALLERLVQLAQLLLGPAALGHFGEQGAVGHADSRLLRCSSAKTATFERRMAGFTGLWR